jgi:hypothetical protein
MERAAAENRYSVRCVGAQHSDRTARRDGTQRREFGQLVEDTVAQIEAAQFLPRPGIRFPQNGCTSCPYLGLCLQNQPLIEAKLLRCPGGDLGWLDELAY